MSTAKISISTFFYMIVFCAW